MAAASTAVRRRTAIGGGADPLTFAGDDSGVGGGRGFGQKWFPAMVVRLVAVAEAAVDGKPEPEEHHERRRGFCFFTAFPAVVRRVSGLNVTGEARP